MKLDTIVYIHITLKEKIKTLTQKRTEIYYKMKLEENRNEELYNEYENLKNKIVEAEAALYDFEKQNW